VSTRMPKPLIRQIDDWADRNEVKRSEAMRRLVEIALTGKMKAKLPREALVADLAAETIDSLPRADRPKRKT
jgi:metal-responsive CopG/Arc/MetJ family transcriptional regulator